MAARRLAVELVMGVLRRRWPLEQVLGDCLARPDMPALAPRDRAFARAIAAETLRHQGGLDHVLSHFLERGLPQSAGPLPAILLTGTAQLLLLRLPSHAVVDIAVELARRDRVAHRFAKLVNAVLRRVAERGEALLDAQDRVRVNVPDWLWQRWSTTYGEQLARQIAEASLREAPLDITVKGADAPSWADRLSGRLLPTGTVRLASEGRVADLAGFVEGAWWVQDTAAALVARVAGDVRGRSVADLCAAPGGKTAALAAAGARVTAVDVSAARLARLRENLQRLELEAEIVEADIATWAPGRVFDVVLLDAPCTGTGTIRRHPDILRLKRPHDVSRMAELQRALLANAAPLVSPAGLLIYSTCSLEPEEGEAQIARFLASNAGFERVPIVPAEIAADPSWISAAGELRTLPCHLPLQPASLSGLDGFYAARLRRRF